MTDKKILYLHVFAIVLATAVVYYPSLSNDFIWDDDDYILNNFSIQRPEGLKEIWFSTKTPQYYPVVFTSFWVEYHLWGQQPFGYRCVNLLFHILNALLLYTILKKLYPPLALAAALIFALHPVQVETVAWITERKNIFGAFFYLLAVFFYIRFDASGQKKNYGWSFLSFVLALLSKSITVTFVMVPLLIRWWQARRIQPVDLLRLVPFGLVGLLAGLNTIYLEIARVGAKGNNWSLPLLGHILLPGKIILFYIVKLVFPFNLSFVYPRWEIDPASFLQWIPALAIGVVLVLAYLAKDRIGRGALATLFFFAASLFPALGFFNVYPMIYSYVADHFQYIASIGMILFLCGAASFGYAEFLAPRMALNAKQEGLLLHATLLALVLVLGAQSFSHSRVFKNRETLFTDVVHKNPNAWMAHNNLGLVYLQKGEVSRAVDHYQETLKIKPGDCVALTNMGTIFRNQGAWEKAKSAYESCLMSDPEYSSAYNSLGILAIQAGDERQAQDLFEKAIALDPMAHSAHLNLGQLLLRQKRYDDALAQFQKAIGIHPYYTDAYLQMGILYAQTGENGRAEQALQKVLQIDPNHIHAANNLGILYRRENRLQPAIEQFRSAVRANPDFIPARYNLAEALLTSGQKPEALFHFAQIARAGVDLPRPIQRLLRETKP